MKLLHINFIGALTLLLLSCSSAKVSVSDRSSKSFPAYEPSSVKRSFTKTSQYITVSDGVSLAVDYYIPEGSEDEQYPTILYQTKYWRSIGINFPFSLFVDELSVNPAGTYIQGLVEGGYAVVAVDIRGSGASTGSWEVPFGTRERQDAYEISDWIVSQPWSDGQIGTIGISFSAITADVAVASGHPAIKAHMPMFGPYDLYEDLVFPGGIYHEFYLREWQNLNEVLDQDKAPVSNILIKAAVKGVARIKGEKKRFKQALADHKSNVNVHEHARKLIYRDDPIDALGITSIDEISPHIMLAGSEIPTYAYSGWYDGGYQHAAIRRFLNSKSEHSRLTIGPWDHGGGKNASPADPGSTGFVHINEVLRFFDYHLMDITGALDTLSRVHYFTQLAGKWQTSDVWPPKTISPNRFYLGSNSALSEEVAVGTIQVPVDSSSSAGTVTRWEALAAASAKPPLYPDRKERDHRLTIFESAVFEQNMELTGHPILSLDLGEHQGNSALIAYLELVSPSGEVTYMTEGRMYDRHGGASQNNLYRDVVPQPSYNRKDEKSPSDQSQGQIYLDLLPTSFLIPAGYKIRLALATADAAHFRFLNQGKTYIPIVCGEKSYLDLPLSESKLQIAIP